jgi:surface protein
MLRLKGVTIIIMIKFYVIILSVFLISCVQQGEVKYQMQNGADNSILDTAPIAQNITRPNTLNTITSIVGLQYSDAQNDLATSCQVIAIANAAVSTPCSCLIGYCSVGITPNPGFNGLISFSYNVTAGQKVSNLGFVNYSVFNPTTAPVASYIPQGDAMSGIQKFFTLDYTDIDADHATSCTLTAISNASISTACSCVNGVCTVGLTSSSIGATSFSYYVIAGGQASNVAVATFNTTATYIAPVAISAGPLAATEDTTIAITLNYTNNGGPAVTSCQLQTLNNLTETVACACSLGVCTVSVTGTTDYHGAANFEFTVNNGVTSNWASVSLTIASVDDAPVAQNIGPIAFNEDTEQMINLVYSDVEGDLATSCTLDNLNNITETTPCSCVAGSCSVGVTGLSDYNGTASFTYQVHNALSSNVASASLVINPVDDAPVVVDYTASGLYNGIIVSLTLPYTDVEGDEADSCEVSGMTPTIIIAVGGCSCSDGLCTQNVRISNTHTSDIVFNYRVVQGSLFSNTALYNITSIRQSMVTRWNVTAGDEIELPLPTTSYDGENVGFTPNYNFIVSWGDGSAQVVVTDLADNLHKHVYATGGTYEITIAGQVEAWSFGEVPTSREKIYNVINFGDLDYRSLYTAFYACENLIEFRGGVIDNVISLEAAFLETANLSTLDLSSWNTHNVINLSKTFSGTIATPDVSHFNTTSVRYMVATFANSITFNPAVYGWDTRNVRNFSSMFAGSGFSVTPLYFGDSWSFRSVTNATAMFSGINMTASYDQLLGIIRSTVEPSAFPIQFDVGPGTCYTAAGEIHRNELIVAPYNWIISGDTNCL